MTVSTTITTPIAVGRLQLKNRLVLAPLTRLRNSAEGVPHDLAATYYAQRATEGGLEISEATIIAHEAGGLGGTPGIHSKEQIAAWKKVTDAVHAKGGYIFSQLGALGRTADPKLVTVYGPSDDIYKDGGSDVEVKAFSDADIDRYVELFRQAALNAIEAGFDGIEIHGANGFLIDQFLQSVSNHRTDQYGGSVENRIRFPLRVVNAVSEAIGADRVGLRISPYSTFQGMLENDPPGLFEPWVKAVVAAQPNLAYIHAVEERVGDGSITAPASDNLKSIEPLRDIVDASPNTKFIAAGGFTPELGDQLIAERGGLVAFGRHYIANPDLLARIVNKVKLNEYDRNTFYGGTEAGYTDYPTYEDKVQA